MHRADKRFSISNHHGDVRAPNNLELAKKIFGRSGHEIDIYEVDFVSAGSRVVSAHDYNAEQISTGSPLEEWIDFFVVQQRKILWLDVKENIPLISTLTCGYDKFDWRALFQILEAKRDQAFRNHLEHHSGHADDALPEPLDITNYVIVGCQDAELHDRIVRENRKRHQRRWHIILDSPGVWAYVLQYLTPGFLKPQLCDYVCDQFRELRYHRYNIISIDQSFFSSQRALVDFIKSLQLSPRVMIIVNSYDRQVEPIVIENHYVVMQYDYSMDFLRT